jgi:hypothetical protein
MFIPLSLSKKFYFQELKKKKIEQGRSDFLNRDYLSHEEMK